MSATMQPTKDQWKRIEEALSGAYGSVDLDVDGYALRLEVRRTGTLRYEILPFVNGWNKGEWISNDCEERRRFLRPVTRRLYSPAKVAEMTRRLTKRAATEFIERFKLDASHTYYLLSWPSMRSLRRHLVKNNERIRLLRIHNTEELQA